MWTRVYLSCLLFPAQLMPGRSVIPGPGWELRTDGSNSHHSLYPRNKVGRS